jgi:hypothetical protein
MNCGFLSGAPLFTIWANMLFFDRFEKKVNLRKFDKYNTDAQIQTRGQKEDGISA